MIPTAAPFVRPAGAIVGAASAAAAVPLFCILPGAEERLAWAAAFWGPKWTRGFSRVTPAWVRAHGVVEPGIKKGVKIAEPPFKKAALAVDRSMKRLLQGKK